MSRELSITIGENRLVALYTHSDGSQYKDEAIHDTGSFFDDGESALAAISKSFRKLQEVLKKSE